MQPRIARTAFLAPDAMQALQPLGKYLMNAGGSLPLELVCMRASQINGCLSHPLDGATSRIIATAPVQPSAMHCR